MLFYLIGVVLFGWFIDKVAGQNTLYSGGKAMVASEFANKYNPVELGFNRMFNSRYPWKTDKNHTIGDIDPSNPKPFVDPVGYRRKLSVNDGKQKYTLGDNKQKAYALIHERYNLEEHHKFDPDFGHKYPKATPWRKSKIPLTE